MTVLATDNYNRANGGMGANWTTSPSHNAPIIVSNHVEAPGVASGDDGAYYSAIAWPNDQYSQMVLTTIGALAEVDVCARIASGAFTAYIASADGAGNAVLNKVVAGSFTLLGSVAQSWSPGDVVRVEAQGTSITMKRNGSTVVGPITDSAIAAGNAGIETHVNGGGASSDAALDTWEGGDFTTGRKRRVSTMYCVLLALLALCLCAAIAHAATPYYVSTTGSGTTCSLGNPCGSIATGIGKLAAGDTLYLRGGTYTQSINSGSTTIPSGTSWSNAITIAAYPGETVTLMPSSGPDTIVLNAISAGYEIKYIIFDRLILDGTNTGNTMEMFCDEGGGGPQLHHIRFQNGEIRYSKAFADPWGASNGNNVHFSAHNVEFLNSWIHHSGSGYGFYFIGSNNLIENCIIEGNYGFGIQIYSNPRPPGTTTNIIRNNSIHDNGVTGNVFAANGITVNHVDATQIYNNLIYNNQYGGMNVSSGSPDNTQIYNNTFYNNGNISGGEVAITLGDGGSQVPTNTKIRNNIFYQNRNNSTPVTTYSATGTVVSDNLTSNPAFVAAGTNFHLTAGSAALNIGATLGIVTTDKDGIPRPQGAAYDVGAYELATGGPSPATYYVAPAGDDTRSCATATVITTPRQTLAGGLNCLLAGGSTLYLRAGTYVEAIDTATQFIAAGTSWAVPTKIAAYADEVVTIQLPASGPSIVVFLRNATNDHYLVFDRLILDANNRVNTNGFVAFPGVDHIRFQNGTIKNTYFENVFWSQANNIEILTSTLLNPAILGNVVAGTCTDCMVRGNTIHTSTLEGIGPVSGDTATNLEISANIIHGTGSAGGAALIVADGSNHLVFNNILYSNGAGIRAKAGAAGAKFYNNTVYGNTNNGIQIDAGASNTVLTNNLVYNNGGGIVDNGVSTTQTTNLTTNPPFTNPGSGDFTLTAGAVLAIDTGTTLAAVPTDQLGITRPQGAAYDIGALEFVGTPTPPPPPPPTGPGVVMTAPPWMTGHFMRGW